MFKHFNIMYRQFHILLIVIVLAACPSSFVYSQDVDWVVEPIITDADEIDLEQSMQTTLNLIKVKKDGKWGIKNTKNELIVPIEYKYTTIWRGGKHCEGRNGRDQYFFDQEGYEVEFDEVDALNKKLNRERDEKKRIKNLEDLTAANPDVDFSTILVRGKYHKYVALNKKTGDTISNNIAIKGFFVTSSMHSLQTVDKERVVVNGSGEIVKPFDKEADFVDRKGDRIIYRVKRPRGLFDENFNTILPFEYNDISFLTEDFLEVSKDGEVFNIIDVDGNIIPNTTGSSIYVSKKGMIIIKLDKYKTGIFDPETQKVTEYDWKIGGRPIGNTNVYQITNKDTLSGLYDFDLNKEVVPCMYRRARVKGSLFVGGNYPVSKKQRRSTLYQLKTVFNLKGEEILKDSIKGIMQVGPELIYTTDRNGNFTEYDGQGKLRQKLPEGIQMLSKDNRFISHQKRRENLYIPINDYLSGKEAKGYTSISKPENNKEKTLFAYKVNRDGKQGVIDQNGNILLPLVFDEIKLESHYRKYLIAKVDGKWGVLHNPLSSK
ncbi:MAG: WG repeat-containing protein [Saprospiraceae bacterium]|nr:WG repeat-containing protein [Saprospiraceae bacterium]